MEKLAEQLVSTRILGPRKGLDVPAYLHSFDVRDSLKRHGFASEVCLAGLLHDIVEDGKTTLEELRGLGFSERVVELVGLCSHDPTVEGSDIRWFGMVENLFKAGDRDAWAIKLADLQDNIADAKTMPPDRARFMYETKRGLILALTQDLLGDTAIWKELKDVPDPRR